MSRTCSLFVVTLLALALPAPAAAQPSETAQEIRQLIRAGNTYSRENLRGQPNTYSSEGALEFWSSGGLMQRVSNDQGVEEFESFGLTAKYISVVELAEDVALAMYYSEGSMHVAGMAPVSNYFTRVTQVFVREDGEWKIRASHFSPVMGGTGTNQTSVN